MRLTWNLWKKQAGRNWWCPMNESKYGFWDRLFASFSLSHWAWDMFIRSGGCMSKPFSCQCQRHRHQSYCGLRREPSHATRPSPGFCLNIRSVAFNGPSLFFFNRDARKANVQQPFFPNLIGTSSQSDRLYLQFLESFFLYLVQVDRAYSVADPSNDVSNDSHLASWFILNGHPHHSRHSEHLSLEGDWDMAVRRLSFQECQPIWDLRMKYDEIFYVLFSI